MSSILRFDSVGNVIHQRFITAYGGMNSKELQAQFPMPADAMLSKLYAQTTNKQPAGATNGWSFVLRVNGVDTNLVATVSDGGTTNQDTLHTVRARRGDLISLQSRQLGVPNAAIAHLSLVLSAVH